MENKIEPTVKKKSSKKKIIAEIVLIVALLVFVVSMFINDGSTTPAEIGEAVTNARYRYFFAAIGVLLGYMFVGSLSLRTIMRKTGVKASFIDTVLISQTEYFFNGITPGAVGGQPFQVFAFNQVGVPASKSTGAILMNFVCGMLAQLTLALCSLAFYPLILEKCPSMITPFWIGFFVNVLGTLFFAFLGFSKTFRKLMVKLMNWVSTWKIMRKFKGIDKKFEEYMTNAQTAFSLAWAHKSTFLIAYACKLLQFIILYAIPFFILKAIRMPVGHEAGQLDCTMIYKVVMITSFAMITASYVPTPGATGALEFAFKGFFLPLLIMSGTEPTGAESANATAGVLLWRIVSYYMLMLFSFISYFVFTKKQHRDFKIDNLQKSDNCQLDNEKLSEEINETEVSND
ncbi:MAG: flippase-like domain-containing protein [Acholeplasmatales bacterium]|nr:flippase-like domain-containing protein [Acholeplasmatales bacterium]